MVGRQTATTIYIYNLKSQISNLKSQISNLTNTRRRRLLILFTLATITLAWGVSRGLLFRGLIVPLRVASGSMAPALLGPHYQITCRDCRFRFACDRLQMPSDGVLVCPNCGCAQTKPQRMTAEPGQRVFLDRLTAADRLRRYDVIVARRPDDPGRFTIKRVVGLPGETIRIDNGDLFADEQRLAKSPRQFQDVAILVHDDRFRLDGQELAGSSWRPESANTRWERTNQGYVWQSAADSVEDWLVYHHTAALPPPYERGSPSGVLDNCPYNQGTSRVLNRVSDGSLSLIVTHQGCGTLHVRRQAEQRAWTLVWHTDRRQLQLIETNAAGNTRELATANTGRLALGGEQQVEFGYWDGHFHCLITQRPLMKVAVACQADLAGSRTPWSISPAGFARVAISNLQIHRDIFYTDAYGTNEPWTLGRQLGAHEFLTLGDNSPVSRDARHSAPLGRFQRSQIEARVAY